MSDYDAGWDARIEGQPCDASAGSDWLLGWKHADLYAPIRKRGAPESVPVKWNLSITPQDGTHAQAHKRAMEAIGFRSVGGTWEMED